VRTVVGSREREFGLLQKIYPTSTLASVSSAIQKEKVDLISLSESGNEITLTRSASKASINKACCHSDDRG